MEDVEADTSDSVVRDVMREMPAKSAISTNSLLQLASASPYCCMLLRES